MSDTPVDFTDFPNKATGSGDKRKNPSSKRHRGPQGLGEQAACALADCVEAGRRLREVEEAAFLQTWFEDRGCLILEPNWQSLQPIRSDTAEHEVRYRQLDHRAVKRTWPGTFGLVPREEIETWVPRPATPSEYLTRFALQNETSHTHRMPILIVILKSAAFRRYSSLSTAGKMKPTV